MLSDHRRILVTGFGPFPGVDENLSSALVARLQRDAASAGLGVHLATHVLHTEWRRGPDRVAQLFESFAPSAVIHFGVSREARGFRIETQAHNVCRMAPDAAGQAPPDARLHPDGAQAHPATLPIRDIVRRLERLEIPVSLSRDAGGYLCNAVLYHSLRLAQAAPWPCRAGFVHIPAQYAGSLLTEELAARGALEIVRACLKDGTDH